MTTFDAASSKNASSGYSLLGFARDLVITLILWGYFTLGFLIIFSPFYLVVFLFPFQREHAMQGLNHLFYRGFFILARGLMPGIRWHVAPEIRELESCVIISNHLSYLDPLIMISLFRRHKTIVKSTFFKVPIFGWALKASGYIPSMSQGGLSTLMIRHTTTLKRYLDNKGVLFVFPEGTRRREPGIASMHKGAFKLARLCKVPIRVLVIQNTEKLFTPGRFLFNSGMTGTISVTFAGSIEPDYDTNAVSITQLMETAGTLLENGGQRS